MAGLLISVENADEAALVLSENIAILDVKSASDGSLGRVEFEQASQIAKYYFDPCAPFAAAERPLFSIALGELKSLAGNPLDENWLRLVRRFHFAKIGLAGLGNVQTWPAVWRTLSRSLLPCRLVAVAYLDHVSANSPTPETVIEMAGRHGCSTILFDTCYKTEGNLFDVCDSMRLEQLVGRSRQLEMKTVVAGSVDLNSLPKVARLLPDFVGIRGAVCIGDRSQPINKMQLEGFVTACQETLATMRQNFCKQIAAD